MSRPEPDAIRATLLGLLGEIAPEADLDALGPRDDLRERLDVDSYDLLRLIVRLEETLGVHVPDDQVGQFSTLESAVAFLATCEPRAGAREPPTP